MTIYHSKRNRKQRELQEHIHTESSREMTNEFSEVLNKMAKDWIMKKATEYEPEELVQKLFQVANNNKIVEQGITFVKDISKKLSQVSKSEEESEEKDMSNLPNNIDLSKVFNLIEENSEKSEEISSEIKVEAIDIINQVMERTKEILNENKETEE